MKLIRPVLLFTIIFVTLLGCPVENIGINVIYDTGESTGGTAPSDPSSYRSGDSITVLGNSGFLVKEGAQFIGWNTQSDGEGVTYTPGETFIIGSRNVTLYPFFYTDTAKDIAAGSSFTYILMNSGSLWVTGFNGSGQLGTGDTIPVDTARKIMEDVKAVSAGQEFAMILKNNGDLYATGENSNGQLGSGDYENKDTPTLVATDIAYVDCGYYHTMAIDNNGDLWATGANGISGVLGNDSQDKRNTFLKITIPDNKEVASVSAAERHTLFVTTDGNLYGMGDKHGGKLIRPYTDPHVEGDESWYIRKPVLLSETLTDVRSVSAGENHSMAVTIDNELYAFGTQNYGALGNGVHDYGVGIFTPFKVTDPLLTEGEEDIVQQVTSGRNNTLIITTEGTLLAVGSDYSHNLGDGNDSSAHHLEIFTVDDEVTASVTNGSHTVYGTSDGKILGAGYDHGPTSNGSALGQGPSSTTDVSYKSFIEIPLSETD